MADTLTTSGAAPASAGGSSSPTSGAGSGSSSPATPATPSTPSTGATPSTPSTPAVADIQPGESNHDFLRRAMETGGPLTDEKKPEAVVPPVVADPLPDAAAVPEVADPSADPAVPPVVEVKPEVVEANPLDKIGPLPAEKLAASFENPEFAAAMEAQGFTKEQFIETARSAALASQFAEVVGTPEIAKLIRQSSDQFQTIEEKFPAIKDRTTFESFMTDMIQMSALRDEQGNPLKNPDGTVQTDGSTLRFFEQSRDYENDMASSIAKQLLTANPDNDDAKDLVIAQELVAKFAKNGYKLGSSEELSPALKAQAEQIKQDRAKLDADTNQRKAAEHKAKEDKFETDVYDATFKGSVSPLISATLKSATALPEGLRQQAEADIYIGLTNAMNQDADFLKTAKLARSLGFTPLARDQIVALNKQKISQIYQSVATAVMAKYGVQLTTQAQAKQVKTDAQLAADRINPKAGTTVGQPRTGKLTSDQIAEQAKANVLAANNGVWPADGQKKYLMEFMKLDVKNNPLVA